MGKNRGWERAVDNVLPHGMQHVEGVRGAEVGLVGRERLDGGVDGVDACVHADGPRDALLLHPFGMSKLGLLMHRNR